MEGKAESWVTKRKFEVKGAKSIRRYWNGSAKNKGSGCGVVIKSCCQGGVAHGVQDCASMIQCSAMQAEIKGCELLLRTTDVLLKQIWAFGRRKRENCETQVQGENQKGGYWNARLFRRVSCLGAHMHSPKTFLDLRRTGLGLKHIACFMLVRFLLGLSMEEEDGWERAVAWIERDLVMWLAGTVKLTIQEAEARNCLVGNQGRRLMEAPGHPNSARKQNIHSCAIGLMNVVCAALMVADVHIEGKRDVRDGGEFFLVTIEAADALFSEPGENYWAIHFCDINRSGAAAMVLGLEHWFLVMYGNGLMLSVVRHAQ